MGVDPAALPLRVGFFGAEPWTENMRREIENRLKITTRDIYGLSEIIGPGVSFECECQNGLHVNEDHFIPEIIDPETGEVLPEGSAGELVFTCITKEALPLIRYRTRDVSRLQTDVYKRQCWHRSASVCGLIVEGNLFLHFLDNISAPFFYERNGAKKL